MTTSFQMQITPDLQESIDATISAIARGYRPKRIILFGSFARGDFHQGSDLDLMIIKNTGTRFVDRIEDVLKFWPGGIPLEPLVYTEKELSAMLARGNGFVGSALQEGKVVYERPEPRRSKKVAEPG
ncbi:MAG: nucleotidyltransferase domain-containing protein [Chloroflexi bacterium]|nr:nucleotidyltransferase domain-containing protein [Chloroflexota bacterium]